MFGFLLMEQISDAGHWENIHKCDLHRRRTRSLEKNESKVLVFLNMTV